MAYRYYSYDADSNGDHRFGAKDKLPTGDAGKVIYGAQVDEEFVAIADGLREVERDVNTIGGDLQDVKRTLNGIEEIEKGDKPGDTLYWENTTQSWVHSGALQVQPGFGWSSQGDEVEINAELCVNSMKVQQGTGNALGIVDGRQGFQIRSYRYDNANDGWTGTTGNTWEILGLEARDDGSEPDRQNGIDLTADRVTIRNTRDYSDPTWVENQIMFRVDGDEVEIGPRVKDGGEHLGSVFNNGDVYVGHTVGNRPDNNDTKPGTLFCHQGIIVGRSNDPNHEGSIGMEGNVIWNLGDPISDTCAVSKGWVENESSLRVDLDTFLAGQGQANSNVYDKLVEVEVQVDAHENRLDRAEPKISDLEQFKADQLVSNQNVYEYLAGMHYILENADTYEAFRQAVLNNLGAAIKKLEAQDGISTEA